MRNYQKKRCLVIGLGVSGISAAKFLLDRGALVVGFDDNSKYFPEIEVFSNASEICFKDFDMAVVSPGISPNHPCYEGAMRFGLEVVGEAEIGLGRFLNKRCIGITGTNGKTTLVLLIEHVLKEAGIAAQALGNVGTPFTSDVQDDVIVAELSSFQLETLSSKVFDVAAILNITPDHLDRYDSFEEYALAKCKMKNCLKEDGTFFVEDRAAKEFYHLLEGSGCKTVGVDAVNLAYLICRNFGISLKKFLFAIKSFKKPMHRVEFVREINGIKFYNDSKATNVAAVIKALESIEGKIVLIAGGEDKGLPFLPLLSFKDKLKCICAIGPAASKIKKELSEKIDVISFDEFNDAVQYSYEIAENGDTILLSPGGSSFDSFRNYEHRGEKFKKIVRGI